jgi:hypothetical protein
MERLSRDLIFVDRRVGISVRFYTVPGKGFPNAPGEIKPAES